MIGARGDASVTGGGDDAATTGDRGDASVTGGGDDASTTGDLAADQ